VKVLLNASFIPDPVYRRNEKYTDIMVQYKEGNARFDYKILRYKSILIGDTESLPIRQQKGLSQKNWPINQGVNIKSLSRYELDASIPPADALKAIADALCVSSDTLLSDSHVGIQDTERLRKFSMIQELTGDAKKLVDNFLDMVIRDHVTGKTYAPK